jgi:tetratricopeptide (TPR) repeat protein
LADDGYAVEREFEEDLERRIGERASRVVLITGTAGSGKTSTLMRLALHLDAQGQDVRWLTIQPEVLISRMRGAVRTSGADVLIVDDLDALSAAGPGLLEDFVTDNPDLLVLAGLRSTRYEADEFDAALGEDGFLQFTVPHLEDSDIDLLLDALADANRLGQLRGLSRADQADVFRRKAGRQLIVAMIEATSGERFEEKIARECAELTRESALIYAITSLATSQRQHLKRQEILVATGDTSNAMLNRLQNLVDQHLLIREDDRIRVRHRVVAERAIEYFRSQGQLLDPIRGLLFAMATNIAQGSYARSRAGALLMRTMNHSWLIRMLQSDQVRIREAYEEIADVMSWDHHYWLQRGSFEVEIGDLTNAQNFLEQARALAPDDYKVQTEWAYMALKRATQRANEPDAVERAAEAFETLEEAISRRGDVDAYPYHVMGNQGLAWLRESPQSPDEKLELLSRFRQIVGEGLRAHPRDPVLRQLGRDLEGAYLAVAAVQPPDTS